MRCASHNCGRRRILAITAELVQVHHRTGGYIESVGQLRDRGGGRESLTFRAAPSRLRAFVDFDGTIALEDTTDVILERFADPDWRRVEAEWIAGAIGSRECLGRQIDLVRASPEALDEVADDVPLDPHFYDFVTLCRTHRIPVTVISDGLDRVVNRMLTAAAIDVPVLANHLEWLGRDRWKLEFPQFQAGCRTAAGNCKCAALTKEPGTLRIVVGDGRSDFCAAHGADFILAKGALAEHCQRTGLNYCVFGSFVGATSLLADWIATCERHSEAFGDVEGRLNAPSA